MSQIFDRTEMILGKDRIETLKNSRVAVFGVGGVGGYVVEALARAGVGAIDICDKDCVDITNINRQIVALNSTIGQLKVDVAEKRILDINPDCKVTKYPVFYLPETSEQFDFSSFDYVVDAIDTVTGKIEIIMRAEEAKVPAISAMGAGNKLDPTRFEVSDIYKTTYDPLAKVMRRELKKRGVKKLKVVYSKEEPLKTGEQVPGSISFVPSVAGLIIAGEVIKDLTGLNN